MTHPSVTRIADRAMTRHQIEPAAAVAGHPAVSTPATTISQTVYLAARYSRRQELCSYRADLARLGITVTSRWLNGSHQLDDQGVPIGEDGERRFETGDPAAHHLRTHFAAEDVADVLAAGLLIAFTEQPRTTASRGGRHVELGLALGAGKPVVVIGPRENVFCWLPQISHYPGWPHYLATLTQPRHHPPAAA